MVKTKIIRHNKQDLEKAIIERMKDTKREWKFSKIHTKFKSHATEYFVIAEMKIKEEA